MEIIPRREPQKITFQQFEENTPEKIEMYEKNLFFNEKERINMLKLLIMNVGMETMVKNLPKETRKELTEILKENKL